VTSSPIVADISRDLVAFYSDRFGHEPTAAKTFWWEGIVVCLLGDVFSGYEQVVVEAGGLGQVQANRAILRSTFEPLLRGVVERATGTRVVACLGDVSAGGSASEVFLLEPSAAEAGDAQGARPA
jgi:uncharacterized protein YbcI